MDLLIFIRKPALSQTDNKYHIQARRVENAREMNQKTSGSSYSQRGQPVKQTVSDDAPLGPDMANIADHVQYSSATDINRPTLRVDSDPVARDQLASGNTAFRTNTVDTGHGTSQPGQSPLPTKPHVTKDDVVKIIRRFWKVILVLSALAGIAFGIPAWISYKLDQKSLAESQRSNRIALLGLCLDDQDGMRDADKKLCKVIVKSTSIAAISEGIFKLGSEKIATIQKRAIYATTKAAQSVSANIHSVSVAAYPIAVVIVTVLILLICDWMRLIRLWNHISYSYPSQIVGSQTLWSIALATGISLLIAVYHMIQLAQKSHYFRAIIASVGYLRLRARRLSLKEPNMPSSANLIIIGLSSFLNSYLFLKLMDSPILLMLSEEFSAYSLLLCYQVLMPMGLSGSNRSMVLSDSAEIRKFVQLLILEIPLDYYAVWATESVFWFIYTVHVADCSVYCNFPFNCPRDETGIKRSFFVAYSVRLALMFAVGLVSSRSVRVTLMVIFLVAIFRMSQEQSLAENAMQKEAQREEEENFSDSKWFGQE